MLRADPGPLTHVGWALELKNWSGGCFPPPQSFLLPRSDRAPLWHAQFTSRSMVLRCVTSQRFLLYGMFAG